MQAPNDSNEIEFCPVLRPTLKEFADFRKYVEMLDQKYKKQYGLVKVIPPKGWVPHSSDFAKRVQQMTISGPIEQNISGKGGIYECMHIPKKSMSYSEFKQKAQEFDYITDGRSGDYVEKTFWKNAIFSSPLYGADILQSFMDSTSGAWNLNTLDSLLADALTENVRGVNSPYCYVGSWKAFFCWHTEDLDLSGINFIHSGKSKFWYGICHTDRHIMEKQFEKLFPDNYSTCKQFLRHKTTLINPYLLKKQYPELKINKIEQKEHEFIIVFGGSYHCGFNFGFNLAQAINFATLDWLRQLAHAKHCHCLKSSVRASEYEIYKNLLKNKQVVKTKEFIAFKKIIYERAQAEESQEQFEDAKRGIVKEFGKKIKKMTRPLRKIIYKNEEYEIVNWAQCQKCKLWRILKHGLKQREKFECRKISKLCFRRDKMDRPAAKTITIHIDEQ